MVSRCAWLCLALLWVLGSPGRATDNWSLVRAYACRRAPAPPVLDGKLDDACWQAAEVAGGFVLEGAEQSPPAQPATTVRFCYDEAALYAAFQCHEPNLAAVTTIRHERDYDVYNEDMVGLLLDVGHVRAGQYDIELAVSAAGTQYDFGWGWEEEWNGAWTCAVARSPEAGAWQAELRIPWSDTRQAPQRGDLWGLQAMRWRHAGGKEEALLWSAVPQGWQVEMWSAPSFGHLLFEVGGDLPQAHVARAAARLEAQRQEAAALVRDKAAAGRQLDACYERLRRLQSQAARGERLTGDEWAACFSETDALLRDYADLVWPLRIQKLLED